MDEAELGVLGLPELEFVLMVVLLRAVFHESLLRPKAEPFSGGGFARLCRSRINFERFSPDSRSCICIFFVVVAVVGVVVVVVVVVAVAAAVVVVV